jgi:hypothetical protein
MAIELILEVFDHLPDTVTPQERAAAHVFAEDAWIKPGHRSDRKIFTSLDDPKFQRRIGVSSAKKVQELAQSLARKGVLESVQRGQKGKVAEYRIAHLAPGQEPVEVQDPGNRVAEDGTPDPNMDSTPDSGALNSFSTPDSVRQHPGNWGASFPSPTNFPLPPSRAGAPADAGAAPDAVDRQAGAESSINPNTPPEQSIKPREPATLRAVEGQETSGSDGTAETDQAPVAGPQAAATRVLDAVDFGRQLTRDERTRLTTRLAVLAAGGWTVDGLVKNLGDLGGAQSRVAVFTKKAKELPDRAPVTRPAKKAPGTAEAFARIEADAAATREELPQGNPDAGPALIAEIRARRAQKAAPAAAGAMGRGA